MDTRSRLKTSALTLSLALAAFGAACGPPPPVDAPPSPTGAPTVAAPTPSTTAAADVPTAVPSGTPTAPPAALPPGMPAVSAPLSATKFEAELKKLGFDGKKPIADLEKMDLAAKKKLMPLFTKALGYTECTGCHAADGDYHTSTRNMKISRKMWSQFVAATRDDKGGMIFCDSCHNGATKVLNRVDHKAVGKFMHENYVAKLTRADKQENGCATCHGTPMQPDIIEKLWGIAAR
jgi:decaheme cytochrome c component MtrC/MtrF-like protein